MQIDHLGREESFLRTLDITFREGNQVALKLRLPQIQKKINDPNTKPLVKAYLLFHSSRIYRLFGETDRAINLCELALGNLPADSLGLFANLKRLRAHLYLDEQKFLQANNLLDEIDGTELMLSGGIRMIEPATEQSVETLILKTELLFMAQKTEDAKKVLVKAAAQLAHDDSEVRQNRKLTLAELRDQNQRIFDLGNELYFLEAVGRLIQNEDSAFSILQTLKEKLSDVKESSKKSTFHNANLLAKTRILLNEWEPGEELSGINQYEALRWYRLTLKLNDGEEMLNLNSQSTELEKLENKLPVPSSEKALGLYNSNPDDLLNSFAESFSQLPTILSKLYDKLEKSPQGLAPAEFGNIENLEYSTNESSIAFGGNFETAGPIEEISADKNTNFTGFIELYWVPAQLKGSVMAGSICREALAGRGFIFVKQGRIIDATLGHYEVDPQLAGNEENALEAVLAIVQISYGIGIDKAINGYLRGYHSAAIQNRTPRLNLGAFDLAEKMTELEKNAGMRGVAV